MKTTTLLLTGAILAGSFNSMGQSSNSPTNVKIIHHTGNHLQLMDTVIAVGDDYSPEQFILDNGFSLEEVEIIRTNGAEKEGVWVMKSDGPNEFEWESASCGEKMNVFVRKTDGGNRDFEMEERYVDIIRTSELDSIDMNRIGELQHFIDVDFKSNLEFDGKEKEVKVMKVINDDGLEETRAWINGEEVDPAKVEGNVFIHEEGSDHVAFEVLTSSDEIENGEVQFKKVIVIEKSNDATNSTETSTRRESEMADTFTIVIVTESEEVPNHSSNDVKLKIDDLNFYPNPNEGRFQLQFTLPQEGATQIEIFNTSGQQVYQQDLGTFRGTFREDIDISDQPAGHYILHITQNGKHLAEKVIVK